MKLPQTVTETEFMDAFQRVAERIKKKFRYAINDGDDLAQEALFIAVKVVESYNPTTGPLYNFLSVAVGNRIKNFIRDAKYKEIDAVSIFNIEEETLKIGNMKTTDDEFWRMIDENLGAEYRTDYLKMRQGIAITSTRKARLMSELRRIVNELL